MPSPVTPFRRALAALAACAALAAGAGPAAGAGTGAPWLVDRMESGKGCYVARELGGGASIAFHYLPAGREFRVLVADTGWDAWVAKGNQLIPMDLRLALPRGSRLTSTPEGFTLALGDGVEALAGVWRAGEGDALRQRLREARTITLSSGGTGIGTYAMAGAGAALDALMRCAAGLPPG